MDHFEREGLVFEVRDSGGDGDAVVCLHGFPQDTTAYDEVSPLLTAQGLRVLVPLQRGYSPGAQPTGRPSYALPELVADVLALLDSAGVEAAHVVGHDWGGAVAWPLAGRHADRVLSITALSTPHPAAMKAAGLAQVMRSSYMALFQVPALPEALALARDGAAMRALLSRSGLPDDAVERYAARMCEPGTLAGALGWYRGLVASRTYRAGAITVPTTYLWGRHDPFFAPAAAGATGQYVRGAFRSVEVDTGHWLPETRPHEVAHAVLGHVHAAR